MLKLLRLGNAKGVIIHKIDRSARNLKDWADLGELIDKGVEVQFANESLDLNSRGGRLSADIQAVVAADYIRNLREEAKKGIYGRLRQGFYPMRAPLGYMDHGGGKPKTIDPIKGPLIRTAFELYATAQWTIPTLVEEMYRRGLCNIAEKKVSENGLWTILRNPFYAGVIRIYRTGQSFEGNHAALISKDLFARVQDIMHGRVNTRVHVHDFLFRRYVRCKSCGYNLIGERQKGHVYYRCHSKDCPPTSIREEVVHEFVAEQIQMLQFSDAERSYFRYAISRMKADWLEERKLQEAQLTIHREQVSERLNRLTDAYLDRTIDADLFEQRKAALFMERASITGALADIEQNRRSLPDELQKFLELAGNAYLLYQTATVAQKRRLLKTVTSNLTIERKTLDFAFTSPFDEVAKRQFSDDGRPSKETNRTWGKFFSKIIAKLLAMPPMEADPEMVPAD